MNITDNETSAQGVAATGTLPVGKPVSRLRRWISALPSLDSFLGSTKLIAITIVWVVIAGFLVFYTWNGAIGRLVSAVKLTHVEAFGVKLDIDSQRSSLIDRLKTDKGGYRVDDDKVRDALTRGEINAGTVRGARILWVDDEPQNNSHAIAILSTLGISVVAVTNNDAAVELLKSATPDSKFDLIVTDGTRSVDPYADTREAPAPPLKFCPLQFTAIPSYYKGPQIALDQFNAMVASGKWVPGGFRLVDRIAELERATTAPTQDDALKAYYTDVAAPRIVMYSGSNGDIAYDPCIRSVTRQADRLFHSIINILGEIRPPAIVKSDGAGSEAK